MKLHADIIIAPAKLTHYLLIFRPVDYATRQAKDRGLNKTQRLKSRLQEQNPPTRVEILS
jgi:hypothetical protein